jgi:hypothetical protein
MNSEIDLSRQRLFLPEALNGKPAHQVNGSVHGHQTRWLGIFPSIIP